ncbi:hypothetical protein RKE29_27350 [Streptomyces sp. B1866]|uniref:hypothetical protein n=1 Tax=Streptomyces sp. B1866 TaxID=3075431 RepID=UPI00288F768C|nr:hypothetical protein [Streptomyces sp. B1866]MDT3400286.1 hypothetical protein [Streptomyces sp. B1866]
MLPYRHGPATCQDQAPHPSDGRYVRADQYAEDPYTDSPYTENPYTENRYADIPYADIPRAEKPDTEDPYADTPYANGLYSDRAPRTRRADPGEPLARPPWVPREPTLGAVPAGVWWDAVRVRQPAADQVLHLLRYAFPDPVGPVVADPGGADPCLYFLVPRGAAERWDLPDGRALGQGSYLVLPCLSRARPPGTHWAEPPRPDPPTTDPSALRHALTLLAPRRSV